MDVTSYLLGKNAGGGSIPTLQDKSITITENGTTSVTADAGYDGLETVGITTNVSGSGVDEYFKLVTNDSGAESQSIALKSLKKLPSNISFLNNNLQYAFSNCASLETIPNINTSSAYSMAYMFYNCITITTIPALDTGNVTNMGSMFQGCSSIITIPALNTNKVTNMNSMFYNCRSLETIPNLSSTSACAGFNSMFSGCQLITSIPSMDMSQATNISNLCKNCSNLQNVPIYNWGSVTGTYSMSDIFNGCYRLTDISLNNILASCITAINYTGEKTLKKLGISTSSSRIQALSNYQDFIDAGWTIGYN